MRLPLLDKTNEAAVDIEQVKRMTDLFLAKGFTYFDTAWMYHMFRSENIAKEVLVSRHPRDSFMLATKLHARFFNTPKRRDEIFSQQLEKTGAGYFDYYLLHGIYARVLPKFERLDCFHWLLEKKKQGLVKHIGFSFHDGSELLDEILAGHPEMEFVQLQLNYLDWENEWIQSRACYETATKHRVPVIVMEPVKGGTLSTLPGEAEKLLKGREPELSAASWAIRFAASLDNVMMVLSGMSSLEQMEDNLSYMENFRPLTEDEFELTQRVAAIINEQMPIAVPCTGCAYCTVGCPVNIPIPQYFSLYNERKRESMAEEWRTAIVYAQLVKKYGRAKDCIECGQCEGTCPQHLPVIERLKDVSASFDW